jgi:hypothetical protein
VFVNIETRSALLKTMGTKAVVCVTAKNPGGDKSSRITQWFSIEVSGVRATFVPMKPSEMSEASTAACQ